MASHPSLPRTSTDHLSRATFRERPRARLHNSINNEVCKGSCISVFAGTNPAPATSSTILGNCDGVSSRLSHHWVAWLCHQTGPGQFSLRRKSSGPVCPLSRRRAGTRPSETQSTIQQNISAQKEQLHASRWIPSLSPILCTSQDDVRLS